MDKQSYAPSHDEKSKDDSEHPDTDFIASPPPHWHEHEDVSLGKKHSISSSSHEHDRDFRDLYFPNVSPNPLAGESSEAQDNWRSESSSSERVGGGNLKIA